MEIAQLTTDRIISELEKGGTPWVKPWRTLKQAPGAGMPYNPASKTVYRGINHTWLSMQPYAMPWYLTFKQAQQLGGTVKAGEKGTPVVFWKIGKRETVDATGDKTTSAYALVKNYWVFNVEQCEGIEIPALPELPKPEFDQSPAVMGIVDKLALSGGLTHAGDSAYYRPSSDGIVMPPMAAFTSAAHYHATLLHESVHATGHKSRLDRLTPARFGSENYAYEELVAELGAAMLCCKLGVDGDLRHADYIGSWLKALKNDKKFILSASAKAQAAMDYLTDTDEQVDSIAA